jgi:nucleoside-diphosphate-sugar epimerase
MMVRNVLHSASRSPRHVVTGATGLVGSAIIIELLRSDPRAEVFGLVRAESDAAAVDRLHQALERTARLFGLGEELDADIRARCRVLAADVRRPGCGVRAPSTWAGGEFWHCAASLQFQDRYAAEVMQTNVEGTRHALELARALEVHTFNMVSTAYVAGQRKGPIPEAPVELATFTGNNNYERSKVIAEGLVLASGLRARILRPSVVIGHSRTRGALTYSGLYAFTRGVFKFRRLMERTQAHLMDRLEVRLLADPETPLDFVPVDFVARDAVGLARADAAPGIYHLAAIARLSTRCAMEAAFGAAGLRPPVFVSDRAKLTWLDRKLDEGITVYSAYFFGNKRFVRAGVERWLERPAGAGYALSRDELRRFCDHYVETELLTREPLPVTA